MPAGCRFATATSVPRAPQPSPAEQDAAQAPAAPGSQSLKLGAWKHQSAPPWAWHHHLQPDILQSPAPSKLCLPLRIAPRTDGHWRAFDSYSNPWTTLSTLPLMQTPHKTWPGKLIHVSDFLERWLLEDELNMNMKVCPESVGLATSPCVLIFLLPWHRKQEQ